jgi:hypothetical protein
MELEQSVKFVRINTGEDLITQITEVRSDDEAQNYYILTNPMRLMYVTGTPSRPGMFSINLMQWVFHRICKDQDFTIYPDNIVTIGEPTEDMVSYYWDCVDNFYHNQEDNRKNTEYQKHGDDTFEDVNDDAESLRMLQELLEGAGIKKSAKGTLH